MKKHLSITDMANLHNISRQTLIYYDKIGLFKPDHIDDNGYRYYNPFQIPFLREICFLKSLGIRLEDIKKHIKNRNPDTAASILEYHKASIDREINKLLKIRRSIQQKLDKYSNADYYKRELNNPWIQELPERKAIFIPYENDICKQELHLTFMKARNILIRKGILPSEGFGTMIMKSSFEEGSIFHKAGGFILLPPEDNGIEKNIILPAGKYACMYKYGMPYDTQSLLILAEWISKNNYKIDGNIIDECILDTTFYEDKNSVDLCKIQIPVSI